MRIICADQPGPAGNFVATQYGLVPFDAKSASDLAHDAMLLALSTDDAERLEGVAGERQALSLADALRV